MKPWNAADLSFDADAFSGVARLFPLPNLVLYPHVMQPLHIFEERYREMLEDALASDRLIAMALLEPGWEADYDSRPPIAPFACLGKVVAHHRLPNGRYNLLLMGVGRVRIVRELEPIRSFRQAQVELLQERFADGSTHHLDELQRELMTAFERYLPCSCQAPEQLRELLARHLPLGMLTDLAAYALPLDIAVKQQLLAECRVDVRAQSLLAHLESELADQAVTVAAEMFPPPFSVN
jgi:Lon protease-like protein